MKILSSLSSIMASLVLVSTIAVTPVTAHASIFGDLFFKSKIDAIKGNVYQNRDNRNQLLERIKADKPTHPLSPEERQALFLQQLATSISNFTNIHDRIAFRVDSATDGQDVTPIQDLLSAAESELTFASTTMAAVVASTTATTTPPYDPRLDIANIVSLVNAAKNALQQALDTSEQIL